MIKSGPLEQKTQYGICPERACRPGFADTSWSWSGLVVDFVCLFELMLYVPVNSNGHAGTLPPFYGTLPGCHDTQNVLHKYNHPTKPICMDGLTYM